MPSGILNIAGSVTRAVDGRELHASEEVFSFFLDRAGKSVQLKVGPDPDGKNDPTRQVTVGDIHATILDRFGIEYQKVMTSPIGRTVKLTEGQPIKELGA